MQTQLRLSRDEVTPDLKRRIRALRNRRPVLLAMGMALVSLGKRAFSNPTLRPTAWAARKRPKPHPLLVKSSQLRRGIHVGRVTNETVAVGSPMIYAGVHQFGSRKKTGRGGGIPPRPFMPIVGKPKVARLMPAADSAVARAAARMLDSTLS